MNGVVPVPPDHPVENAREPCYTGEKRAGDFMLRIALCDDDREELQRLEGDVRAFLAGRDPDAEFALRSYASGPDLLAAIERGSGSTSSFWTW